jgi:hypothetical protein
MVKWLLWLLLLLLAHVRPLLHLALHALLAHHSHLLSLCLCLSLGLELGLSLCLRLCLHLGLRIHVASLCQLMQLIGKSFEVGFLVKLLAFSTRDEEMQTF